MASDARKAAERAMPGWKAVQNEPVAGTADSPGDPPAAADQRAPDLAQLRRKYAADVVAPDNPGNHNDEHSEFVTLEPVRPTDATVGRKVVLVRGSRVIGSQG